MTVQPIGPLVTTGAVRRAALDTLALWAPTYVAEVQRQSGLDLPGFVDFVNQPLISPEPAAGVSAQPPRYVVACPGPLNAPTRYGDGNYRAVWDLQVGVWMWGGDYQDAETRVGWYVAAIRAALLQHGSLGGFAEALSWRGERYAEVSSTAMRTWGQAVLMFGVEVDGVVNAYAGPAAPAVDPTQPPSPWPQVTSARVTVTESGGRP